MTDPEKQVEKNVLTFCKYLPSHVEAWRKCLEKAGPLVKGLANRAEQLRFVKRTQLNYVDGFEQHKAALTFEVGRGVDEDVALLKPIVECLNRANQDLRNRLAALETSTLSLDWSEESPIVRGSATVPSLSLLLQSGLHFYDYFASNLRSINSNVKGLDCDDEEGMRRFERAFAVDLKCRTVTRLVAVTQYVGNEKAVI